MIEREIANVFVVDDEELIADTLALILRREGFDAEPFFCSSDALAAAERRPPDLLISDVVMPGLSGVELAIRIRKQYPGCAVLLFSGQAGVADLLKQAQAQGYNFMLLSKPVHPTEILEVIRGFSLTHSIGRKGGGPAGTSGLRSAS